jgi:conjugal transfer ATP-binding protein TraC
VRPQSGADEELARVLTALYAASPPGTGIQFHLYASPAIHAPLARYANLRVADDVVPELDALGRAGRHTNIHRTMARRRAGHYLQGSRTSLLSAQSYLFRDYRLVVSVSLPGSPENLSRLEELLLLRDGIRATLHAAGFPSRSWSAEDLINWVSALLDPHRRRHPAHLRRRTRAARPGDRPGHAPAHRPPGHRPGQPRRRPANRASPDVGARLPAALRAVERRQPDR